jgi:type I restriction enzyme M protein
MSDVIRVDTTKPTGVSDRFEIVRVGDVDWAFCPIRRKAIKLTGHPEEVVRQRLLFELHEVYKYPLEQMRVEVPVVVGSTEAKKRADIVIYKDKTAKTPRVFVEVKKEKRLDGLDQLKVYMNATGSRLGLWYNGSSPQVSLLRIEPTPDADEPAWRELRDIAAKDEQHERPADENTR